MCQKSWLITTPAILCAAAKSSSKSSASLYMCVLWSQLQRYVYILKNLKNLQIFFLLHASIIFLLQDKIYNIIGQIHRNPFGILNFWTWVNLESSKVCIAPLLVTHVLKISLMYLKAVVLGKLSRYLTSSTKASIILVKENHTKQWIN